MLDFNHKPTISEQIAEHIDSALQAERALQEPRDYLGASRIGAPCERQLQFEYTGAPVDPGREFKGQLLRVFEVGHALEDLTVRWLRAAGFELITRTSSGEQIGFSAAGGRFCGHVDGIVTAAPAALGLSVPMLWESKSLHDASWKDTVKHGVAISKPIYAAQLVIYQAYLDADVPGLSANPALFTAVNKDTQQLHIELVPFDAELAQRMSDRAVRIIEATAAHDLLPRCATTSTHFICKSCPFQDRCWSMK